MHPDTPGPRPCVALAPYGATISGGERVALDIAAALVARGDRLLAVVPATGPTSEAFAALGATLVVLDLTKTYDLFGARRLAAVLREHDAAVLQTHGFLRNLHGRYARLLFGGPPAVGVVHRALSWRARWAELSARERWRVRYYQGLDRLTASGSATTVAVSGAVRQDLLDAGLGAARLEVIPNGIADTPAQLAAEECRSLRRDLGVPEGAPLLFTAARLSPLKDVATMVRALAAPGAQAWHLAVAGDGPEAGRLRELVATLGLGDRVHLLGPRDDVGVLLAAADAFGLSSIAGEGLPIALLEAMRQGLPAVVTHEPGTLEAARHEATALVVPRADPAAFGAALGRLSGEPALAATLGRGARADYEARFGLTRMTQAHLAVLDRAMAGAAAATP